MIKKKRKFSVPGIVLIVLSVAIIVSALVLMHSVSNDFQYILPGSANVQELRALYQEGEKMLEALSEWTDQASILGKAQGVSLSTDYSSASVTLHAVPMGYFDMRHETLKSGRLISGGDMKNYRDVILIDEKLAYQLFPGADAIGKLVTMGDTEWTIVGLLQNVPRFGETSEWTVYVPITASFEHGPPMQTLELKLRCKSRDTPSAILKNQLTNWRSDGSFYELSKEKTAALMPLRWLLVILSCAVIRWLVHCLIGYAQNQIHAYREMLAGKYAKQMLGWLMLRGAILLLGFLIIAGVTYGLLSLVMQAALAFPDWIPEKPVSIASYISRFWSLHRSTAASVQFCSQESSVIALAAWLIRWGCFLLLAGCCTEMLSKILRPDSKKHDTGRKRT